MGSNSPILLFPRHMMQPCQNVLCCMLWWGCPIRRLGKGKGKYFSLLLGNALNHQLFSLDLHQRCSWCTSKETKGACQEAPMGTNQHKMLVLNDAHSCHWHAPSHPALPHFALHTHLSTLGWWLFTTRRGFLAASVAVVQKCDLHTNLHQHLKHHKVLSTTQCYLQQWSR